MKHCLNQRIGCTHNVSRTSFTLSQWFALCLWFLAFGALGSTSARSTTLMRFPSSSAHSLAFVAYGNLWLASRDGGSAHCIVKSSGDIEAARFSPDGRWIAYTERSHRGQDVFIVGASGGTPRRLTFDARRGRDANLVVGWAPDSKRVLFLSNRRAIAFGQLQAFAVPITGGMPQRLPLAESGSLTFAPDGRSIAYTPTFTDLWSRKRYIGGEAEDIYLYDLATKKQTRVTHWKGTDTAPMWWGKRLYFLSDRGPAFRLNIWRYDLDTHTAKQITHFVDYDIDSPSLSGGRITFQQGGKLWAIDLPDEHLHQIHVAVPGNQDSIQPRIVSVGPQARSTDVTGAPDYAISPGGGSAFIAAHGDIFQVPLERGAPRDITSSAGIDEDHPSISPNGKFIAYITEDGMAQQVAVRPISSGPERQLTHFTSGVFYAPVFSPNGRMLMVSSAEHDLWIVPLTGGVPKRIAHDPIAEIRDGAFSPNGRWLAYSTARSTGQKAIHLYELATGRDVIISSPLESDWLPTFSSDSKTLFFVSQRHELAYTSDRGDEATLSTLDSDGVYGASLASATTAPRAIMRSAVALPVPPGRYVSLQVRGRTLFYEERPPKLVSGEDPDRRAKLGAIDVSSGRSRIVLRGFNNQIIAGDGRIVLFRQKDAWRARSIAATGNGRKVNLSGLRMTVNPRAEWREMFEHAWQLDRDLFFSRAMNGTNWQAVHDAYAKIVPLVSSRGDMVYLLRQLQGELATSHTFIDNIDPNDGIPPVNTPMLGADLAPDARTGLYLFKHVYAGDPTRARFRSPLNTPALNGPGVHVKTGEYLTAIDGIALRVPTNPNSLLAGKTGQITLTIASRPGAPTRKVRINPLRSDLDLRQHDWVAANRAYVSKLSRGRIGYIFLADFDANGAADLFRQFQAQIDKEGLIIDVRWNRGGYLSQAVLDILRRVHAGSFINREGAVSPLPLFVAPRAMAVLTNAQTASDGEQFAYYFRADGLGPVVGQRTWGGVQGIKGDFPLMDGLAITIPKDSLALSDGHWAIENEGVQPDITVNPSPDLTRTDRQLEVAVKTVVAELKRSPSLSLKAPPPLPAYPPRGEVPGANYKWICPKQRQRVPAEGIGITRVVGVCRSRHTSSAQPRSMP